MLGSPRQKFLAAQILHSGTKLDSPRTHSTSPSSPTSTSSPHESTPNKYGGIKNKNYQTEKVKELLENYTEVPKSEWHNISIGSHIRYLKADGDFKPGGYVRFKKYNLFVLENIPFSNKKTNSNYVHWSMRFDNTAKIFLKDKTKKGGDEPASVPMPAVTSTALSTTPSTVPQPNDQYDPRPVVDNGLMQIQIDDNAKKIIDIDLQIKKIQNDIAELTIFSKKIGKYIQTKGLDLSG